ncbi:MAG: CDP-glycerol glycerophosphotransferase family protein [Proteobacteria bacterium]|nr:CDP-glycerol glycerophosphotransferase family protein [Pseudomonadota bacterium]
MGRIVPRLEILRQWADVWRFQLLPAREKSIVFYSEGPAYWVHLQPVIESLVEDHGITLCYLSSHPGDPGLSTNNPRIKSFCIGEGDLRTSLFKSLKADVVVMTMSDLGQLRIKRSVHPVHYVHVFHSIVSTHMVYRKGAFDYFDSLFLVGPHQRSEIRRMEELDHLPAKNLVEHGYGRLDSILHNADADGSTLPTAGPKRIVYAPSWGGFGRPEPLKTHGEALTARLLEAGFHVTVRSHPMSQLNSRSFLDAFAAKFRDHPRFIYEEDMGLEDSLHQAHLMISDWSGAAFDFAYGLERPVLFMDIPRKINNPAYEELGLAPLEETVRSEIGRIMAPAVIDDMVAVAGQMIAEAPRYAAAIRQSRARNVFNVGESGKRGAEHILELRRKTSA